MSLSPDEKALFGRIMSQLLATLEALDRMPCNPHTVDLIEIAGSLLEQQVKEDKAYDQAPPSPEASDEIGTSEDMDANETQRIIEDSPLASFAKQASDAEEHVNNGLADEIIKQGGFLFLNSEAKMDGGENKDIPSPDDLKGWFDI